MRIPRPKKPRIKRANNKFKSKCDLKEQREGLGGMRYNKDVAYTKGFK